MSRMEMWSEIGDLKDDSLKICLHVNTQEKNVCRGKLWEF